MTWLRRIFGRKRLYGELTEEIRAHLEERVEELVAEGMRCEEAEHAARREFGNVMLMEETARATWRWPRLEDFLIDVRYALRMLRKSPGFTAVAVLTLALGIGANTAIFSVADGIFWNPLPYHDAKRLVFLTETTKSISDLSLSYPDFLDWQKQAGALDGMAAFQATNFDLDNPNGPPERISGRYVSSNFFRLLGVAPKLGRDFVASDDRPGASAVALASYTFWKTHLGASGNALGTTIRLNGRAFTLVGVLPQTFAFETPTDVFTPIGLLAGNFWMQNRGKHPFLHAIARLKPGASLAQAQAELETISRLLQQEYPASNAGVFALARPLREELAQGSLAALQGLAIAVTLLLLISCANVANLLLTRASHREAEFAVRAALGAGRARIVRQLLTESAVVGLLGATAGLALAGASLDSLGALVPANLRSIVVLQVNATMVVFIVGLCLVSSIGFGIVPSLFTLRAGLHEPLKSRSRAGGAEPARRRMRGALAVSEIAFAFMALVSAGLVLRSFRLASEVNPGFDLNRVLTLRIDLSHSSYATDAQRSAFLRRALSRLRTVPGVVDAGAVFPLPFTSQGYPFRFSIAGRPVPSPSQLPSSNFHFITPQYFHVMGIPLLRGRDFSPADDEASAPVAVVSENFADRYWPDSDPIGKRIDLDPAEGGGSLTVVGVAGNTKESGLDAATTTEFYLPYAQRPIPFVTFVLRTRVAPLSLSSAVLSKMQSVDSVDPLYGIRAMNDYAAEELAKRRTNAFLFSAIALLIIVLSAIGVYAVISHAIAQRNQEMGVRLALGAQRVDLLRLVLSSGGVLWLLGIALGTIAGLVFDRTISGLLFGVSTRDPVTFASVAALLALVVLLACYVPARRAMRVDPMTALRNE